MQSNDGRANPAVYHTVEETADLLRVSPATVYRLVASGHLRAVRVGARLLRVPAAALLEFELTAGAR